MKKITILRALACLTILTACSTDKTESSSIRKEVKMTDENGQQKLTIKTTENGKTITETFEGQAAKDKMSELEAEKSESGKKLKKVLLKKR